MIPENSTIHTLGPEGSFHENALLEFLPSKSVDIRYHTNFGSLLTEKPSNQFIWIAVSNAIAGLVGDNKQIALSRFNKLEAYQYGVSLTLASKNFNKISELSVNDAVVYSHIKALQEASIFLNKHLAQAKQVETRSTSEAAEIIANQDNKHSLAICHKNTALSKKLTIIAENIGNVPPNKNLTLFFLLKT